MAEEWLGPINGPVDAKGKSAKWLTDILRRARTRRFDDPEAVAEYGAALLKSHASSLTQAELWTVREQVAIAALRSGRQALALQIVKDVHLRFRTSVRASRLAGLLVEAAGDVEAAANLYERELELEPNNPLLLKRRVAAARAAGNVAEAALQLRSYLIQNSGDVLAWEELAELYVQSAAFAQAAFCLEEVVLHRPGDADTLLLLADVLASVGGTTSLRAARSRYAMVIELTGGRSARACYGVLGVAAQLSSSGSNSGRGPRDRHADDDVGLPAAAAASLLREYERKAPEKLSLVQALAKAQGIHAV